MNLKRLLALALAVVMLLSLCACGKNKKDDKKKKKSEKSSQQTEAPLPGEVGRLTVYCNAPMHVIYDKSGKVLAVKSYNEQTDAFCKTYEKTDKSCPQVVLELIDYISEQSLAPSQAYILLRQTPDSETPNKDFLKNIQAEATLNKGEYQIILAGTADLDKDGLFNKDTALAVLKASLPTLDGVTISCADTPDGGSYSAICTDATGVTTQYSIGALDGSVIQMEAEEEGEPQEIDPWADIPESDVIPPLPDVEANKGADGGNSNGSVKVN